MVTCCTASYMLKELAPELEIAKSIQLMAGT